MTTSNKTIAPFCVLMSDATEDEIRSLHKMCLDAGASHYDAEDTWVIHKGRYPYMGVDNEEDTFSIGNIINVGKLFNNNIINLYEVPSHLGLDTKEDETLVAGTIEHAYKTLKGDSDNCENGDRDNNYLLYGKNLSKSKDGYYSSLSNPSDEKWTTVCTIKEFKEYASNRKKLGEISGVKPLNDESPYEGTKPLKWTLTASKNGGKLQTGMIVKVKVSSTGFKGEGVIQYIGKESVVVDIGGSEEMLHLSCIKAFREKTPEEAQRNVVVQYLDHYCGIDKPVSEGMYDDLLRMGVFKESK